MASANAKVFRDKSFRNLNVLFMRFFVSFNYLKIFKLKKKTVQDLLGRSEGIPNRDVMNLKKPSATTSRSSGIKTLLPVRSTENKKEPPEEVPEPEPSKLKRKRQVSEPAPEPVPETSVTGLPPVEQQRDTGYIVEGGEVRTSMDKNLYFPFCAK